MPIISKRRIMSAEHLIDTIRVGRAVLAQIDEHRSMVKQILEGNDPRWLVMIGPCSAWPSVAVLEYGRRLAVLSKQYADSLMIIMRCYIQKPRTAKGWTGPLNQPDPFSPPDIERGMIYCRTMMRELLQMGLALADEALFTHNANGFLELLSWVAVGARSTEDQEHRIFASMADCAVGMKNPTSGSLKIGVNGVLAAQHSHTIVLDGNQVNTSGNPHAHLVLRGGEGGPNYYPRFIIEAAELMGGAGIQNPSVVIDASHGNAVVNGDKHYRQQIHVVRELLEYLTDRTSAYDGLRSVFRGVMIESNILEGCQSIDGKNRDSVEMGGLSITDPCIGWSDTEAIIDGMAAAWQQIHA